MLQNNSVFLSSIPALIKLDINLIQVAGSLSEPASRLIRSIFIKDPLY